MSKAKGGGEKKLVTEDELRSLVGGFAEQLAGGAASAWGGKLGQTDAVKGLIQKLGTGLFASVIGTVGLAGLGAVLSNKKVVGSVLGPLGVPDGFVAFFAENVGDVTEGLQAERLRQMSKPEAERALADHASKKVFEMSKKLDTKTYEEAYRLLGIGQKRMLDDFISKMSNAQREEWEKQYRLKLTATRDIADALEIATDASAFVAFLGRAYPAKPEGKAQAAAIDFAGRLTKVVVGAVEKFVEDPKAGLQGVADDIEKGNKELKKKLDDARQRTEERKHKPFR